MDFTLKSRAWAENIFQKFEAICQEVDDIVSQDKLKYVENHVHTVGENMKKFCSDVVQDLLPPSVNPITCKVQEVFLTQDAATGMITKPMISIDQRSQDNDFEQSNIDSDSVDLTKKQLVDPSSISGLHLVNELTPRPSLDPIEPVGYVIPEENEKVSTYEDSNGGNEEIGSKKPSPSSTLEPDGEKSEVEGPLCGEFMSETHGNTLVILTQASPSCSVYGKDSKLSQNEKTTSDNIVDEPNREPEVSSSIRSSESAFSVVYAQNKISEMGSIFSGASLSKESFSESAILEENIPEKTRKICNPDDAGVCSSINSSSFPSSELQQFTLCENKAEKELASSSSVLSVESSDVESSRISLPVTQSWLSGYSHDQSWESSQLESFMSSSDMGRLDDAGDDLTEPCMETIELSDQLKLEDSCVIVDNTVIHAFSRRARNLRSYKKLIQDAFASKRRLAKEYEQLAIWYGDANIDITTSQHTSQYSLPSVPTTSSDLNKIQRQDLCDSEWELL